MSVASDKEILTLVRRAAMNLLARREHSASELRQKLAQRFKEYPGQVRQIINDLADNGLQSDERFTESFINHRAGKGYGAGRILRELEQKGIDESLAGRLLTQADINWLDILQKQYEKKYRAVPPQSPEEKAQYIRFFLYRGFSHSQIKELF